MRENTGTDTVTKLQVITPFGPNEGKGVDIQVPGPELESQALLTSIPPPPCLGVKKSPAEALACLHGGRAMGRAGKACSGLADGSGERMQDGEPALSVGRCLDTGAQASTPRLKQWFSTWKSLLPLPQAIWQC